MQENKKITPKQHKAIAELIQGSTRAEAAQAAGVNEGTIYKWLNIPEFNQAMRQAESDLIREKQAALIGRIEENLTILDEIKRSHTASDNARIRAIQLELETMLQWRTVLITEERITDIEKRLENLNA